MFKALLESARDGKSLGAHGPSQAARPFWGLHTYDRSRPDFGIGFQVEVFETLQVISSWLGSGEHAQCTSPQYRGTSLIRNSSLLGPYNRTVSVPIVGSTIGKCLVALGRGGVYFERGAHVLHTDMFTALSGPAREGNGWRGAGLCEDRTRITRN